MAKTQGTKNPADSSKEQTEGPSAFQKLLASDVGHNQVPMFRYLETDGAVAIVESRLPDKLKGQGRRLLSCAKSYLKRQCAANNFFSQSTVQSFIDAINDAAEFGFPLDGKHCYAVPYRNNKTNPPCVETKFQPSYIGMIAVGRRVGILDDAVAYVVMPEDELTFVEENGTQQVRYSQALDVTRVYAKSRGILARVSFGSNHRYEWRTKDEIDALKQRSQAVKSGFGSPWDTDPEAMAKKAGLRQALKFFSDDPAMIDLMAADDSHFDLAELMKQPARIANEHRAALVGEIAGIAGAASAPQTTPDARPEETPANPPESAGLDLRAISAEFERAAEAGDPAKCGRILHRYVGPDSSVIATPDEQSEIQRMHAAAVAVIGAAKGGQNGGELFPHSETAQSSGR